MRSSYSDVNWFLQAARVVPVIAGAALLGGMIGGFAMFAIDSALTWGPVSPPQPEARVDNPVNALDAQTRKPVRIVGGAVPDPSAGMSAPPPAQRSSAPAQSQVSSQLLTAKPLGPVSALQPQTTTAARSGAPQPQNQTANQLPVPTQATASQQQRWPDALSRTHQNAANPANATSARPQTAPPPEAAQTGETATNKKGDVDRKETSGERAANADDQDRAYTARHGRHDRRHWRGGDDDASASSSRWQDARGYDRLYDSYGNRRARSYRNMREQPYGNARDDASYGSRGQSYGDTRHDQDDSASRVDRSRSDSRGYGRDTRYGKRSQPEDNDRSQAVEAGRPRPEPFWGGGFFGSGYRDDE